MPQDKTQFLEVAIAVVFDQTHRQLLVCKRKADTVLAGYWEFPGGKCNPGESPAACACREVLEETGITVRTVRALPIIEHDYAHAKVRLHPFLCELVTGTVELLAVEDARWIDPVEAISYHFPEANLALVHAAAQGFQSLNQNPPGGSGQAITSSPPSTAD